MLKNVIIVCVKNVPPNRVLMKICITDKGFTVLRQLRANITLINQLAAFILEETFTLTDPLDKEEKTTQEMRRISMAGPARKSI